MLYSERDKWGEKNNTGFINIKKDKMIKWGLWIIAVSCF